MGEGFSHLEMILQKLLPKSHKLVTIWILNFLVPWFSVKAKFGYTFPVTDGEITHGTSVEEIAPELLRFPLQLFALARFEESSS